VVTFKLFYPFLEGKVKHAKLGGFHCVVMPFRQPRVQGEPGRGAKECFRADEFEIRGLGRPLESCWYLGREHYGCREDPLLQVEENELWVEHHLDVLKERMGAESEPHHELFVRKEVSISDGKERHAISIPSLCRFMLSQQYQLILCIRSLFSLR